MKGTELMESQALHLDHHRSILHLPTARQKDCGLYPRSVLEQASAFHIGCYNIPQALWSL